MTTTFDKVSGVAGALAVAALALAPTSGSAKAVLKTIYSFCSSDSDCSNGSGPSGGLVMDAAGNLYGTTLGGGGTGWGVVFKLTPNADKSVWTETVLHSFSGQNGSQPHGKLVIDTAGNLYGVTSFNNQATGAGLVYEIAADASHTFTVLYKFCSQASCIDGVEPRAGLTYLGASSGQPYDGTSPLYGTTFGGGPNNTGVAFQLLKSGAKWKNFPSFQAGTDTRAGFAIGADATNFYFTTHAVAHGSNGSIYKATPDGGGGFNFEKFWDFCKGACKDGGDPNGIVLDQPGNIYGTTEQGGTHNKGDLLKIAFNKKLHSYHEFCSSSNCSDGDNSGSDYGALLLTSGGDIWGTTRYGGGHNIDHDGKGGGTIFRIAGGKFKKLYSFCAKAACTDGEGPSGNLVTDGTTFYGVTNRGGANTQGSVFSYKP